MSEAATLVRSLDTRWILVAALAALDTWSITLISISGASRREKWLWSGVVLLCPIVGCLLWYVLGPKPLLVKGPADEAAGSPAEPAGGGRREA